MALGHAIDRYRNPQIVFPDNGNDGAGIEYTICDHAERHTYIPGNSSKPLTKSFDPANYQSGLATSKFDLKPLNAALSAVVEQPARDEFSRFIVECEPLHAQPRGIDLLLQLGDIAIEAAEIARVDNVQPNGQRDRRRLVLGRIEAFLDDETVLEEDVIGPTVAFIADSDLMGGLAYMVLKSPKNRLAQ
jgi:hypothetical protein